MYILCTTHRIIDDRIGKSINGDELGTIFVAAMKNVLADGRWTQRGGGQGGGGPGRNNSQSKRANADCAQFVYPLYGTLFYSVIYISMHGLNRVVLSSLFELQIL